MRANPYSEKDGTVASEAPVHVRRLITLLVSQMLLLGTLPATSSWWGYVMNNSQHINSFPVTANTPVTDTGGAKGRGPMAITPNGAIALGVAPANSCITVFGLSQATVTIKQTIGYSTVPSFIAITPDGTRALVAVPGLNHVDVLTTLYGTVTIPQSVTVGTSPYSVAINPLGTIALVTNSGSNTVSVLTIDTTVQKSYDISFGSYTPYDVAITPDGTKAYVCCGSAVAVLDLSNLASIPAPVTFITTSSFSSRYIAIYPSGQKAIVTNGDSGGSLSACVLNLANNTNLGNFGAGRQSYIAITPDGTRAYIAYAGGYSIYYYDLTTSPPTTLTSISTSNLPGGIVITPDQAPTASFTTAINGSTVFLNGSLSSSPVGSIASYAWNFGDGKTATLASPTTAHTYTSGGNYSVSLTVTNSGGTSTKQVYTGKVVTNNGGTTAQFTQVVTVSPLPYGICATPDQAPTASFTTFTSGLKVFFNGSASSSPVGSIASYKWTFGDGSSSVTTTNPTTSHTYGSFGSFTASLTVTNTSGTSTTTVFTGQTVTNYGQSGASVASPVTIPPLPYGICVTPDQAPTAVFTTSINGSTVFLNGSLSSSPVGSIASYAWNFGDGKTATLASPTTAHTYTSGGNYSVSLTVTNSGGTSTKQVYTGKVVTNNGGTTAQFTHVVTVSPSPYELCITPDQAPTAAFIASIDNMSIYLDGSVSTSSVGTIVQYCWDFGDGSTATTTVPTTAHTYTDRGLYTVSLTVTNSIGTSMSVVFTGQMVSKNGGARAKTSVSVIPHQEVGDGDVGGCCRTRLHQPANNQRPFRYIEKLRVFRRDDERCHHAGRNNGAHGKRDRACHPRPHSTTHRPNDVGRVFSHTVDRHHAQRRSSARYRQRRLRCRCPRPALITHRN